MFIVTLIFGLLLACGSSSAKTYDCQQKPLTISEPNGYLNIDRANLTNNKCAFDINEKIKKNFAIRTDQLLLFPGEHLTVTYDNIKYNETKIEGSFERGYLVFVDQATRLEFFLVDQLGNTSMVLEFVQDDSIPIDIARKTDLTINSYYVNSYNINARSMINTMTHLEIVGNDGFSHHLFNGSKLVTLNRTSVQLKATPVLASCSGHFQDASETSHEISGPEAAMIKNGYVCVNLFETSLKDGHYDVDFSNFLDIVDSDDNLIIDDGFGPLIISRHNSREFNKAKPLISFKNQNLVVIYDSPRVREPRAIFKLTVKAQAQGGIIDDYQALRLPSTGTVRYSLKPQNSDATGAIEIKGSMAGADIKITNSQNEVITLSGDSFLPPIITFNTGENIDIEFTIKSKVAATVAYIQAPACSGTLFRTVGSISVVGGMQQSCYWLIGSRSSITVDYCNLIPNGCLEIYSFKNKKPIYSSCNSNSCAMLSRLNSDASYLKITLPSNQTRVQASISEVVQTQTVVNLDRQSNISSLHYPNSYILDDRSSTYNVNAINKSMILSIKDLDIRDDELLIVDKTTLGNQNYSTFGDVDVSNKLFNLTLKRSGLSKDSSIRRGYFISTTIYDSIIAVDTKNASVKVPKNLTSLLIKISADQKNRLLYTITNSTSADYSMKLYDSRSIFGRQVYEDEQLHGSTTSNVLYINLQATKNKITLPELTINYNQVACNQTTDHVCDNETRCVPELKLCKGRSYCLDGSDLRVSCSSGPAPQPRIIDRGVSGITVFFLSVLMFSLGIMAALFGPDMYKNFESRLRSGQYSTFTSTE